MTTMQIETAPWPDAEPIARPRVTRGAPKASTLIMHGDGCSAAGLWRVTAGEFETVIHGYTEFITIRAGRGRLAGDDGGVMELRPDTVVVLPDGWSGRWVVSETIIKSFARIPTAAP